MDLSGRSGWTRVSHHAHDTDYEENGAGWPCKKLRVEEIGNTGSPPSSEDSSTSVQSPPTPVPLTPPLLSPTSKPPVSPSVYESPESNVDPAQAQHRGLPQEMLQNGWRRCWSARENRWYYFNKLTKESKWELSTERESGQKPQQPQQQQQQQQKQQQPYRKFVPSDDWDLNAPSNVQMPERVPMAAFAPHPDMEICRAQALNKLRLYFAELCHLKEIVDVPSDTINQWIMERRLNVNQAVSEQLLALAGNGDEISPALIRNIMNSIPVRMTKVVTIPDARRLLSKYAEAAKKIVDTRNVTPEKRKSVKWHCESMFDWLRKSQYTSKLEDYLSRLSFLRSRCHQILVEAMKPNVDFVSSRVTTYAAELAAALIQEQRTKLEACNVKIPEEPLPPPRPDKIVPCYSIQLRWPCATLPEVRMEQTRDDEWVNVTYKEETLRIRAAHFYKLEQLYKHNCFDDRQYDCYLSRVWSLLKRHDTLFTSGLKEGVKLQQSVPTPVFHYLHEELGVTFECFASPLNCHFRQYCSLFADTDGYFGSRGSFFQYTPASGSMQMNPPHCEEVMNAAVDHAELLLENAQGPMSFVIFLPDWREPLLQALVKAERSKFWRCQITLAPLDHVFRHGFQHASSNSREVYLKSMHGTTVIVLQNDSGRETWPADEGRMAKLAACFKQPLLLR